MGHPSATGAASPRRPTRPSAGLLDEVDAPRRPGPRCSTPFLAAGQVEIVLQPDANVAAERERRHRERPLLARDADHLPARAGRHLVGLEREVTRAGWDAADDAHDEREVERRLDQAEVCEHPMRVGVPGVRSTPSPA